MQEMHVDPWVWKISWRKAQRPTAIFLHGEFSGQRSLAGTVHRLEKSWTWLKWLTTLACTWDRRGGGRTETLDNKEGAELLGCNKGWARIRWNQGRFENTPVFDLWLIIPSLEGFPGGTSGKEPAGQFRRCRFDPWLRNIPWRRKWQPTSVFLPEESHGQRNLMGYKSMRLQRVSHDRSNLASTQASAL